MLIKLGQSYRISLLVTDINNNRVSNDTPIAIIKDLQTGRYWNGIAWSDTAVNIVVPHISNGVYSYLFTPDKVGMFELVTTSPAYHVSKTETLEVYSGELASYDWSTGNVFTVQYTDFNSVGSAVVKIFRQSDETNFDGISDWVMNEVMLPMILLQDNVYTFDFTPPQEDMYTVSVLSGTTQQIFNLNVKDNSNIDQPKLINNTNFASTDGTDCTLMDDHNRPLQGVQISVYDFNTKELVAKTVTNAAGQWSMLLKPNKYFFLFEKQGYTSISFERSVI